MSQISLGGGGVQANNYTLDGVPITDMRGFPVLNPTIEAIEGVKVQVHTFDAEMGRTGGGVFNTTARSGSNAFHGSGFFQTRPVWGQSLEYFSDKRGATKQSSGLADSFYHLYGGGIGGPIAKEKLFFFFSGDQQLRTFPATANSGNPGAIFAPITVAMPTGANTCASKPSATGITEGNILFCRGFSQAQVNSALGFLTSLTGQIPRTGDQLILLPKIDWNISSKHHASFTYNRLRWASPAGIQTAGVVNRGLESFGDDFVKEDWGVARLTSTFTNTIANEFRYQIGRDFEYEFAQAPISGEPVSAQGSSPQITVNGVGGFVFGKPNFLNRPAFPKEMRNQFADTISWSHGTHLLKFGADINHVNDIENNLFSGAGAYTYSTRADYISDYIVGTNGLGQVCAASNATMKGTLPCFNSFTQQIGPTTYAFSTDDLAFFFQDDWRVAPHFTMNIGLRYETELLPSPQVPNSALPLTSKFPSDRKDFGPRLGFAWDITGDGKTIARAGYGIFYGRIINSTIANAISNTANLNGSQLSFFFPQGAAGEPSYPNVVSSGTLGALQAVQFAPHTSNPMVHEFDVDFQREVATNTVVSLSYLGSLGGNLPRFVDVNLAPPTLTDTYKFQGGPFDGQSITVPVYTARLNKSFGAITNVSDSVHSKYNAVVVALNRRFYQGFQIQTSFTYSHSHDAGQSSQTFSATNNVLNPLDLTQEQGRSNFDIRERFAFGAVWTPELYKGSHLLLKELVNGFTISPLITISAGAPYTGLLSGTAPSVVVGGTTFRAISSGVLGAGGTNRLPNLPPNAFQMPRTANVDLRLEKGFHIREKMDFVITGDAFNALNRNNITAVNTTMYAISGSTLQFQDGASGRSLFGLPTQSSNNILAQRQIQIGARLNF